MIGGEGQGLKIALTTLNTGRLSLPAMCVGAGKWSLNVAREWAADRVQWGRPVGEHEAVAKKIAFIAATTYGMESMLDLCCMLADDDRNDIRIEAALVKLFASEMAWQIADELIQIRGGRGYETADSLAARGERAVAVEQILRDLRINRIFEGSTEIMHLLIAREAVDAHLSVAGDIIDPDAGLGRKARAGARAGAFYARWLPTLAVGRGQSPAAYGEFGPLAGAPALRRAGLAQAGPVDLLRACPAGRASWSASRRFLGRIVDIGAELFAMSAVCVRARAERDTRPEGVELADLFCRQARLRAERALRRAVGQHRRRRRARRPSGSSPGRYAFLEEGVVPPPAERRVGGHLGARPVQRRGRPPPHPAERRLPDAATGPPVEPSTAAAEAAASAARRPSVRSSSGGERVHAAGIAVAATPAATSGSSLRQPAQRLAWPAPAAPAGPRPAGAAAQRRRPRRPAASSAPAAAASRTAPGRAGTPAASDGQREREVADQLLLSRPASASARAASAAAVNGAVSSSPTSGTRPTLPPASARLSAMPLPAPSSFCPGTASFWTRSCSHMRGPDPERTPRRRRAGR